MPYNIIINDRDPDAPCYYCGQGFLEGIDTTVDISGAVVYPTLTKAVDGPLKHRQEARVRGWRIVPVRTEPLILSPRYLPNPPKETL